MYDQGIALSQTAYKPTAPRGRVKGQKQPHKLCDLQEDVILTTVPYFLNKLGRVPLGDATYQISSLSVSDKNVV